MEFEGIVVILERGKANKVVKKAVDAGARGATIVYGRGSGEQVFSFFRSLQVESSKEAILIISPKEIVDTLFAVVCEAAEVDAKGKSIAFTIPIGRLAGADFESDAAPE